MNKLIWSTFILTALLSACGDKNTCPGCTGLRLDMTGLWDVTSEFGEAGQVTDRQTMTLNAVMMDSPERGDFMFQLPAGANLGASFTGNSVTGDLALKNSDFGTLNCSGSFDHNKRTYASKTCTIAEFPGGLYPGTFINIKMVKRP